MPDITTNFTHKLSLWLRLKIHFVTVLHNRAHPNCTDHTDMHADPCSKQLKEPLRDEFFFVLHPPLSERFGLRPPAILVLQRITYAHGVTETAFMHSIYGAAMLIQLPPRRSPLRSFLVRMFQPYLFLLHCLTNTLNFISFFSASLALALLPYE